MGGLPASDFPPVFRDSFGQYYYMTLLSLNCIIVVVQVEPFFILWSRFSVGITRGYRAFYVSTCAIDRTSNNCELLV